MAGNCLGNVQGHSAIAISDMFGLCFAISGERTTEHYTGIVVMISLERPPIDSCCVCTVSFTHSAGIYILRAARIFNIPYLSCLIRRNG